MPTDQTLDSARARRLALRLLLLYLAAAILSMVCFALWTARDGLLALNLAQLVWRAPMSAFLWGLPFLPIFLLGWAMFWLMGRKIGLAIPTRATLSALGATLTPIILFRLLNDRIPGQDWIYERILNPITVIVPLVTTLLAALLFRQV